MYFPAIFCLLLPQIYLLTVLLIHIFLSPVISVSISVSYNSYWYCCYCCYCDYFFCDSC